MPNPFEGHPVGQSDFAERFRKAQQEEEDRGDVLSGVRAELHRLSQIEHKHNTLVATLTMTRNRDDLREGRATLDDLFKTIDQIIHGRKGTPII